MRLVSQRCFLYVVIYEQIDSCLTQLLNNVLFSVDQDDVKQNADTINTYFNALEMLEKNAQIVKIFFIFRYQLLISIRS